MQGLIGYCLLLGADHTATGFLLYAAAHEHAQLIVNPDLLHFSLAIDPRPGRHCTLS